MKESSKFAGALFLQEILHDFVWRSDGQNMDGTRVLAGIRIGETFFFGDEGRSLVGVNSFAQRHSGIAVEARRQVDGQLEAGCLINEGNGG